MSIKISSPKFRLIALIAVESGLILNAKLWEGSADATSDKFLTWHFLVPLIFGIFVVVYAYTIRCPNISCKRRQVFRGSSIFDLRLPSDKCYYCKTKLPDT